MIRLVGTLFLLIALSLGSAVAQDAGPKIDNAPTLFQAWEKDAAATEAALEEAWTGDAADEQRRALIEANREAARVLSEKAKAALVPLQDQMNAIGAAPEQGESEDVTIARERAELQRKIEELKAVVGKADLAFTRADRLVGRMSDARRRKFTQRLMTRGPTPINPENWGGALTDIGQSASQIVTETTNATALATRRQVWSESGPIALAALLFALVVMVVARRQVMAWLYGILGRPSSRHQKVHDDEVGTDISTLQSPAPAVGGRSRAVRLMVGIGVTLTRLATPLVALIAARFALTRLQIFGETGEIVMDGIAGGIAVIATAYAIIYAFFAPHEPRLRLSTLGDAEARTAARYAQIVALAMALNVAFVRTGQALGWSLNTLSVVNALIVTGGAIALFLLAATTARGDEAPPPSQDGDATAEESETWLSEGAGRIVRRVAYAVAILSPLLAFAGYFALSRFIFYNTLLSGAVVAAGVLFFSVAREGMSALSEAARDRRGETKADEDEEPGLLPVFIGFCLILLALPLLALIWGATTDDLGEVYFALSNGFKVGETTFRPGDLLVAAIVFGVGLFVTRVVQAIMRRTVMPRTRLDTGARSSIVSGLGYVGFFISVLMAIGAGGLDLTNLAFLGAALGVGIGFGLQNIVNNFVSGIILLIERPIKVGDWIEVAGTHGTVEKVNVRSTEIKTFDKASYIVPNSELISGAVTNMTHGDMLGRVIAPIGVDYGTDVRQVERILLEIAKAHPMVLRRPAPQVIFQGFGASSLDFELRAFLRDVMWVVVAKSDINFEIERRFREEGIDIPFAQQDITIRNLDQVVAALSARPPADRSDPPES